MRKRKFLAVVLTVFVTALMLGCALLFSACNSNSSVDTGSNTEQTGDGDGQQGGNHEGPDDGKGDTSVPDLDDTPETPPDEGEGEQEVVVMSVALNKTSLALEIGESETLSVTVLPNNATDKSIIWVSSAQSVATVVNGKVTAVGGGTTTITATTSNGKKATCSVTVNEPAPEIIEVTSISLSQTSLTLEIGESQTLTAAVLPDNATDKSVTWSSSEPSVATVENGKVTAVSGGTTTITATTSNGKTAQCIITVEDLHGLIFEEYLYGYSVAGYNGQSSEVIIPDTYRGKPVLSIGTERTGDPFQSYDGLYGCYHVTSVQIPESVEIIQSGALAYTGIVELNIPVTVRRYGYGMLAGCNNLQYLRISTLSGQYLNLFAGMPPESLKKFSVISGALVDKAFEYFTGLDEVELEEGCTAIGASAFINCKSLKKISIPDTLQTIGDLSFSGCSSLENIVIPDSVTQIGEGIFKNCSSLKELSLPFVAEDVPFIQYYFGLKQTAQIYTYYGSGESQVYPDEVRSYNVGGHIFGIPVTGTDWYYNGSGITIDGKYYEYSGEPINVTSWESMYEITVGVSWRRPKSWSAKFYYYPPISLPLEKLIITNQQIETDNEVFEGCEFEIVIPSASQISSINVVGENAIDLAEFSLEDYFLKISYKDGSVEKISMSTEFISAADLEKLQTPGTHAITVEYDGIECVWEITLTESSSADTITQSEGLEIIDGIITGIGTCTDSELVLNMPIAEGAFIGCHTITKVTFGPGVTSIGRQAFGNSGTGCNNLTEVVFLSAVPPEIGSDVFGSTWNHSAGFTVYVPEGSLEAYEAIDDQYWQQYLVDAGKIKEM